MSYKKINNFVTYLCVLACFVALASSTVFDPVKESKEFSQDKVFTRSFAAFAYTNVFLKARCRIAALEKQKFSLRWSLHYIFCAKMAYMTENNFFEQPCDPIIQSEYIASEPIEFECTPEGTEVNFISERSSKPLNYLNCRNESLAHSALHHHLNETQKEDALVVTWKSGVYIFVLGGNTVPPGDKNWTISLDLEVRSKQGDHLSAINWPLLPFWACMCAIYGVLAAAWLGLCGWHWRDLLRLQIWIGAVILLGMIESAVFLGEVDNINKTGVQSFQANIAGEIVSAFKRTIARMLVIIVSLGYGIVKPQLGPALPRVIIFGVCFFLAASVYGVVNVLNLQFERIILYASIPVSIVDAVAAWWIFSSLVETTRLLRIRRNVVKLSLYKHFINTLALCLLAAVAFMVWSIRLKIFDDCPEWSWWWLEEAYWPMLFTIILIVICVLWRPSQNNQRYAFSPLRDCDDEEEDNLVVTELYDHVKPRPVERQKLLPGQQASSDAEDDLKWVEDNIPSSLPDALIDNDEERRAAKFELSKMQ